MNKKSIILSISLLILVLSIIIPFYNHMKDKNIVSISGEEIASVLKLEEREQLYIFSYEYIYNGKLYGNDDSFILSKNNDSFKKIVSKIKQTEQKDIEIALYIPSVVDKISHQFQFGRDIHMSYSLINNKLTITEAEFPQDFIDRNQISSKILIIKMDKEFNDIMSSLKIKVN